MISRILHPTEIERASVRIKSGNKSGTAFFIFVDNKKHFLFTSEHNIPEGESITLYTGDDGEIEAEVLERIPEHDVAILVVKNITIDNITALPLKNIQIPYNENWETYGFPVQRVISGGRYSGTVSRISKGTKWDVDLTCDQYADLEDFAGLSGSALIIDGYAVGVIGYDNVGTLGATSLRNIAEVLAKHEIVIAGDKEYSTPDSIEEDILNSTPNDEVLVKINEVITDQIASSYFLVNGSPGSGKTTIAAQLELVNNNHVIVDRFFVKVPESEEYPTQIRATPEFFIKWIEEVCYRALYNSPPPKPQSETTLNDRVLTINQVIQQLSNHYQQQGKIAFLIVDGLDDVSKSKIEDYLFVLPPNLPSNFKVIFSCTSREVLPSSIRGMIKTSNEIKVTPLSIQNAEKFLSEQLKDKQLKSTQITELAQKSEGHPLYMRYLIKYVLETADLDALDNWIDSIPAIGGEIENYYNKIWRQLDNQTNEIWLAATLARLRVPVEKNVLQELLPSSTKDHFISSFKEIQHLLRDKTVISIYHTSFSDFINEKTTDIKNQVHANIAEYVLKHRQTNFGISERVYHLAHGNEQNKRTAIEECNQTWVDDCALNSINPDIVLADIKNIIGIAAELGIAHKVISLLLLSQRVNFRYNTLFQENAVFLVNALLSLNKPEEAIRYVVRNKTLITGDGDALYLLQKFYEYDANEEAEALLNAINQTCNNITENGFDADSFNRFIQLKFSAVTLSANSDFKEAFHEFDHLKRTAIKMIEASGNPKEVVNKFKDDIGSFNGGYFIWRFNIPPISKKIEEELKSFNFDDRSSGYIALTIYHALDFQEKSPKRKKVDNIPVWIEDLEYVIDKYGTNSDYHFMLLHILLGRSRRVDIIEALYQEVYPNEEKLDFRKENGVDLNHQSIHRFTLYAECLGFFDTSNKFPELPKYGFFFGNWEGNIKMIFLYICFLDGKIKRYQMEGKVEEIKSLESNFRDLFEKLIPDLRDRMNWKRGYALPESIYPNIYKRLIHLLKNFFPNQVIVFTEVIVQKKNYQLGLYTEGYTDSLFVIARELAKDPEYELSAFKVTRVLEEHIITTIENRWERNEYLLRLIELYALLKNKDKAADIFEEMIDTSMGPSWYKEAQLGIINTAVSNIIPENGDQSYLQKFAAHLHNASGEMTFQRYVKQQQEEFVGDLAKIGFLDKSISYFKYLLLPDYRTVIDNAELCKVDMPYLGHSYVLGARGIEEQSGILDMLRNIDCKGSLIAWGLSELFILGDDRYIRGYAKVQASILNYIENNETEKLDIIFKRMSRFVVTEVSDEYRYEYLRELFSELSQSNFERVKGYLESVGLKPTNSVQESADKTDTTSSQINEREDPLDKLVKAKEDAQKKLTTENKSEARKIIVEALQEVQNQNYGIWSFNYSSKINEIRNLLSESYNNSFEFIKNIRNLIINEPYFEEWVIANQIISLLRNINDEQEKQLILSSVLEHIDLMVRTPKLFYSKYGWISNNVIDNITNQNDQLLLELLIWFLNHPSLVVKNRTIEILTWLGTAMPETVTYALINEITCQGYKISKELSASIIHQISNLNPIGFPEVLKNILEQNEQKLMELQHFMIKNTLLDSLRELKSHGVNSLDSLIAKFEQTFIASTKGNGDIIFEEEYLESISDYLYELNELNFLTKEFAQTLLGQIKKMTPLSIKECQKASGYIDRSFNDHNDITLVSDFDTILRYSLNIAISSCVTLEGKQKVADIMRFYQPTFPENNLHTQLNTNREQQFETTIKNLFSEGKMEFEKLFFEGEIVLNYFSTKYAESRRSSNEKIELTSYLIPLDKYKNDRHSYPWLTFSANRNPYATNYEDDKIVIPFFIKSEYAGNVTGSELVPAIINPNIKTLIKDIASDIKSVYWRRGRNWDNHMQGVALKTGYFYTIPENSINILKAKYKLILQVYYGYEFKYIDVFEQKEI
ncbi:serine protease [Zunongwangia sp. F363]|uniref:Serine protease n=1 Tax=Autumnicola tepida TaxID=3075595 RepID=A0ABU3C5Q8_9FLAO|nr:serine protease [Zunongwangia sp. F363]MDT0641623.1 serine protease [Zunongwangia sp. F363]